MLCILLINRHIEITENLVEQINRVNPKFEVAGIRKGVRDSVKWINLYGAPDLIISSSTYADGSCSDIFSQCRISCPVVFIPENEVQETYVQPHNNAEICVALPAPAASLAKTLLQFQALQGQLIVSHEDQQTDGAALPCIKKRITVRKGREYCSVRLSDVCVFFFENGLVFLIDKDNKKFMVEAESLSQIRDNLDSAVFYRANRKYIFSINYLHNYRIIGSNRILVELTIPISETIIISQYRTSDFKHWIGQL